jgi:hypothetical protein
MSKNKTLSSNTYTTLNNENNYKCDGSTCSCKFLNNRTSYDQQQILKFRQNMFMENYNYNLRKKF